MIYCKNCKYFNNTSGEWRVSGRYHGSLGGRYSESEIPTTGGPPELYMDICGELGYIRTCCHPDCFEYRVIDGGIGTCREKRRVAGIAQFNQDNNCQRYRRKFWKFWIKDEPEVVRSESFEF